MAKRPKVEQSDEEPWTFRVELTEEDCEKLMMGRVPKDLAASAFSALSWRREENQDWVTYTPPCLACAARRFKESA